MIKFPNPEHPGTSTMRPSRGLFHKPYRSPPGPPKSTYHTCLLGSTSRFGALVWHPFGDRPKAYGLLGLVRTEGSLRAKVTSLMIIGKAWRMVPGSSSHSLDCDDRHDTAAPAIKIFRTWAPFLKQSGGSGQAAGLCSRLAGVHADLLSIRCSGVRKSKWGSRKSKWGLFNAFGGLESLLWYILVGVHRFALTRSFLQAPSAGRAMSRSATADVSASAGNRHHQQRAP